MSVASPYASALIALGCGLALLLAIDACVATTRLHAPAKSCASLSPSRLEKVYLSAYLFAIAADWLQGPYVYALYESYGYGRHEIALLFVVGFGTSGLFGPIVGDLADRFGRKRMTLLLYCGCYIIACTTKHVQLYWVLMVGRLCGGVATSALFSCFESWVVAEHTRRGLPQVALEGLLSRQYFINGLMGITMGVVAQLLVDAVPMTPLAPPFYLFGEISTFDASIGALVLCALIVAVAWDENYATTTLQPLATSPTASLTNSSGSRRLTDAVGGLVTRLKALLRRGPPQLLQTTVEVGKSDERLLEAARAFRSDPLLLALMAVSSLTEAAMYAFVLEWTPALTTPTARPPHGIVFSSFMVAYMGGSTLFSISLSWRIPATAMLLGYLATAVVALGATALLFLTGANLAPHGTFATFLLLTLFEFTLGGYLASMASIKAKAVPESIRATLYNFFRVPLNLIVVCLNLSSFSTAFTFTGCTVLLLGALVAAALVHNRMKRCMQPDGRKAQLV